MKQPTGNKFGDADLLAKNQLWASGEWHLNFNRNAALRDTGVGHSAVYDYMDGIRFGLTRTILFGFRFLDPGSQIVQIELSALFEHVSD